MTRSKFSNHPFGSLAVLLALGATTCAPVPRISLRPELVREVRVEPEASRCEPSRETLCFVHARVDPRRRLVTALDPRTPLQPRVGILARELAVNGKLERGTDVLVVYRTTSAGCATEETIPADLDAPVEPCATASVPDAAATGRAVAVQLGSGRLARRAFLLREGQAGEGFYRSDGKAAERAHLRYPVEYLLITSGFSHGRTHPILKKRKPHLGVDFAAPRGTPVVAIADGKVIAAGWAGAHGRRVDVRHADGSVSGYSHLERITSGVASGTLVRKGDVIGTVGSSGLATGPHLHFSLVRRGKAVDPLAAEMPPLAKLTEAAVAKLRASADALQTVLAAAERASDPSATQLALADGQGGSAPARR